MPITLAHPAVVLPLARRGLPMSALVIGSMVPDLPMFVPSGGYAVTHSIPGALTVDVGITLALLLVWRRLVRDALVDMTPAPLRERLKTAPPLGARGWLLAVPAAALGALSHVVWDAFTHPGRWGVRQVEWLQADHAGLAGAKWLQYVSGIVGLAVVGLAVGRHLRRSPGLEGRTSPVLPAWVLPGGFGVVVAVGVVEAVRSASDGLHALAYDSVVAGITAVLLVGAVLTLVWHLMRWHRTKVAVRA